MLNNEWLAPVTFAGQKLFYPKAGTKVQKFKEEMLKNQAFSILVLVQSIETPASDADIHFLENILKAIDVDHQKIQQVFIETGHTVALKQLLPLSNKIILSFGLDGNGLGLNINFDYYQWLNFSSFQLLASHPLHTVSENKLYKKALWNALKQIKQ